MLSVTVLVCAASLAAAYDTGEQFLQSLTSACLTDVQDAVAAPIADLAGQLHAIEERQTLLPTQQQVSSGQQQVVQQIVSNQQQAFASLRASQKHLQTQLEALWSNLTAPKQSSPQCPGGWSRHGDSCFLASTTSTSWLGAHGACAAFDRRARLASVHPATSSLIGSLTQARIWIGLSKRPGGSWGWSDGTPLDITRWGSGQPDNVQGIEECALIQKGSSRIWHDYPCKHSYRFLCQIDLI